MARRNTNLCEEKDEVKTAISSIITKYINKTVKTRIMTTLEKKIETQETCTASDLLSGKVRPDFSFSIHRDIVEYPYVQQESERQRIRFRNGYYGDFFKNVRSAVFFGGTISCTAICELLFGYPAYQSLGWEGVGLIALGGAGFGAIAGATFAGLDPFGKNAISRMILQPWQKKDEKRLAKEIRPEDKENPKAYEHLFPGEHVEGFFEAIKTDEELLKAFCDRVTIHTLGRYPIIAGEMVALAYGPQSPEFECYARRSLHRKQRDILQQNMKDGKRIFENMWWYKGIGGVSAVRNKHDLAEQFIDAYMFKIWQYRRDVRQGNKDGLEEYIVDKGFAQTREMQHIEELLSIENAWKNTGYYQHERRRAGMVA